MKNLPPTQNQQEPRWEGGSGPSLSLRSDRQPPKVKLKRRYRRPTPQELGLPQSRLLRNLFVGLFVLLFSIPAYYLASRFIVTAVVIQGRSMSPTLKDGERYYLNRWRYMVFPPGRGDLVVIKDPGHNDYAVKRIAARPKDWVNIKDGSIYVNGKRLNEPYLPLGVRTESADGKEKWIQLQKNEYYVLGDNRSNSEDSRFYGVVHREQILGMIVK